MKYVVLSWNVHRQASKLSTSLGLNKSGRTYMIGVGFPTFLWLETATLFQDLRVPPLNMAASWNWPFFSISLISKYRSATLWLRNWLLWQWAQGQRWRHQPAWVTSSLWPSASAPGNTKRSRCRSSIWSNGLGLMRPFTVLSRRVDDVVRSMYPPLDPILLDAR